MLVLMHVIHAIFWNLKTNGLEIQSILVQLIYISNVDNNQILAKKKKLFWQRRRFFLSITSHMFAKISENSTKAVLSPEATYQRFLLLFSKLLYSWEHLLTWERRRLTEMIRGRLIQCNTNHVSSLQKHNQKDHVF